MNTRELTSSNFIDLLIDTCFDYEDFWYFGIYDRNNHAIFFTANRSYLQIENPNLKLLPKHESLLQRLDNHDENLILFPILSKNEKRAFLRTFIESIEEPKLKAALELKAESALNNWRPYSLDNLISEMVPTDSEIAVRWQESKKKIVESVINNWLEKHKIVTEGITEYIF
jgi:hypothetical protein